MEPADGALGHPAKCHLLKLLCDKLTITGDSSELIATPPVCSQNWPFKQKNEEVRIWRKSLPILSANC
jgi:hypothetical protein